VSDDEIRIAIAEACGWEFKKEDLNHGISFVKGEKRLWCGIPNYPHDLNTMHEAEKVLLTDSEKIEAYCSALLHTKIDVIEDGTPYKTDLFDEYGWFGCVHATARQRAEAFLRTIYKWKESAE
jgi:hypothetical protein